jgi:hypothetical protein
MTVDCIEFKENQSCAKEENVQLRPSAFGYLPGQEDIGSDRGLFVDKLLHLLVGYEQQ